MLYFLEWKYLKWWFLKRNKVKSRRIGHWLQLYHFIKCLSVNSGVRQIWNQVPGSITHSIFDCGEVTEPSSPTKWRECILLLRALRITCVCAKLLQSCPTLGDPMDRSLPDSSDHGDSPGKNIGVGCHALLQGIFPTWGLNPHLSRLLVPPGKSE